MRRFVRYIGSHGAHLSGAARLADYRGSTGTVYAYNGGIDWSPVRDIRFRANYSRAVRAPNLTDLYTPLGQNFAPGFQDPCAADQIGTGLHSFRQPGHGARRDRLGEIIRFAAIDADDDQRLLRPGIGLVVDGNALCHVLLRTRGLAMRRA